MIGRGPFVIWWVREACPAFVRNMSATLLGRLYAFGEMISTRESPLRRDSSSAISCSVERSHRGCRAGDAAEPACGAAHAVGNGVYLLGDVEIIERMSKYLEESVSLFRELKDPWGAFSAAG